MQNLLYTIRVNGKIEAKADSRALACLIASHCSTVGEVKIINNIYSRIAFNSKGKLFNPSMIHPLVSESDERFARDFSEKYYPTNGSI